MADKASFTPEEWARVVASPMVASMAITAADPSGLWGLLREAMSGGWALVEAKRDAAASPLVKAVAEDIGSPETRTASRDWLQAEFKGVEIGDVAARRLRSCARLPRSWTGRRPGMRRRSRSGSARSRRRPRKPARRAASWASAESP